MRSLSFGALGVLSPALQTSLQQALYNVEALHAQVIFDLRTLSDQGVDTSDFAAEADAISEAIGLTQADMMTADDGDETALRTTITTLDDQARDLLSRTGSQRQGVVEQQQFKGLWWAFGAVAVAGGLAWFVWDQRKRRR